MPAVRTAEAVEDSGLHEQRERPAGCAAARHVRDRGDFLECEAVPPLSALPALRCMSVQLQVGQRRARDAHGAVRGSWVCGPDCAGPVLVTAARAHTKS
eukprot:3203882-Prymnesium_polylepis.2